MAVYNKYNLGDVMTTQAMWTDPHDSFLPIDPDAIYLDIRTPTGETIHYEYGVDDEIKRIDVGTYQSDIQLMQPGYYYYRWSSYGTGQAASERRAYVKDSIVVHDSVPC